MCRRELKAARKVGAHDKGKSKSQDPWQRIKVDFTR